MTPIKIGDRPMTTYRGYTIERTNTTVGRALRMTANSGYYLLKITDKNGHAIRNAQGNLPLITSIEGAKKRIREELGEYDA
jgi:sorbitol-specific phosphotransferase system component IIBC